MKPRLYVLTGGSRGMGAAIARHILSQCHTLLSIARQHNADLEDYMRSHHATLEQWRYDLADAQACAAQLREWLQAQTPENFSRTVLINNAASIPPIAPLSDSDWSAISHALRVGLEAPMLLSSAFLRATQSWRIPRQVLNISSGLGRRPMASQATYCAIKAGLDNFSLSLALEEATKPHGAQICSLAPGVIDTDMQLQLRSAPRSAFADVERFIQLKDSGALTSPEEAAAQVLAWLDRSDYGQKVLADVRQP